MLSCHASQSRAHRHSSPYSVLSTYRYRLAMTALHDEGSQHGSKDRLQIF